jgi:hypothetical protein
LAAHRSQTSPLSRTLLALFAIFAWSLAFLVTPALHLERHADDHIHLASGAIVYTHAHDQHPQPPAPHKPESKPAHGTTALAHLGVATLAAPDVQPIPEVAPIAARANAIESPGLWAHPAHAKITQARAPPSANA